MIDRPQLHGKMTNPYAPPRPDILPSTTAGGLNVSDAISTGLGGLTRNLPVLLGAGLVGLVIYYVSFCTCVGWIAVIPMLIFGGLRLLLAAVDGPASLTIFFDGFRDPVPAFLRIWGLVLLWILATSPVICLSWSRCSCE